MYLVTSEMEFGDVRTIRTSGVGPGLGTAATSEQLRRAGITQVCLVQDVHLEFTPSCS